MIFICRACGVNDHRVAGDPVPLACPNCGASWLEYIPSAHLSNLTAPSHDHEFGPLAKYLDAHPGRHAALMRHDGKWVIRVGSALGFGASLGEASASACNALFVNAADELAARAELPTIPEKT